MTRIWRSMAIQVLVAVLLLLPVVGIAADFELFWDPNCNADPTLEGYYIYYKEDASVIDDPSGAIDIYVPLSHIGFDPAAPSHQISDLSDDVRYCFTVTAWYGDEESDMSNEVCGINGTYQQDSEPDPGPAPDPDPDPTPDPDPAPDPNPDQTPIPGIIPDTDDSSSGSSSSGGCFVGALR